jgi:3-isopropylmalate/(R)-2-methylmalate dehydratase small subunit
MSIDKFETLITRAVPLPVENIDTDQIIPARFLKAVERKGFGDNLFRDWRFDENDKRINSFSLNDPAFSGKILLAGRNFGCGSSREHAAWAIYDYGFRVVISSYFADIFKNNALNNGLLPIQLTDQEIKQVIQLVLDTPDILFTVSLVDQRVTIPSKDLQFDFEINPYKKECLLKGYDDFDYLRSIIPEIEKHETKRQYNAG